MDRASRLSQLLDIGAVRSWGPVRLLLLIGAVIALLLSLGYLLRLPLATGAWPLPVTPLTYDFLGAYTLATAATLLWTAVTGELAALAPLGVTTIVAYGGIVVTLFPMAGTDPRLLPSLVLSTILLVLGFAGLVYGLRQPVRDRRKTPRWLLGIYGITAVLLLALGVPLVLRTPEVLPWNVDLDNGALLGWFFIASAPFVLFSIFRRAWPYAAGQLVAISAYDVILALPLILHWPVARPEHLAVLAIYIAIVVGSLLIGLYVFLVDRRYRWGTTG